MNILQMGKEELLSLTAVTHRLTAEELLHIARTLGAYWSYDYEAAEQGRAGMHAILKSGLHSNGFFVSRILLKPDNIRLMLSFQIAMKLWSVGGISPDYVAGVPDGATKLGEDIAGFMSAKHARMMKNEDGRIVMLEEIGGRETLLLVEDFCTRGTGFEEAVWEVRTRCPRARLLPYNPVLINRGGLKKIPVDGEGAFEILPLAEVGVEDWPPANCPLCKRGSVPIKPKATDYNWQMLTTSQLE